MSSEAFQCSYPGCNRIFLDPILLPCYQSICDSHIDYKSKTYECAMCPATHPVPAEGFPRNEAMAKMVAFYWQCDTGRQAMWQIVEANESMFDELDTLLHKPEKFSQDYFKEARNKLDIEREELIERIHKESALKMAELDKRESESLEKYKEQQDAFQSDIDEQRVRMKWLVDHLRRVDITDDQKEDIQLQVGTLRSELETKVVEIKNTMVNQTYSTKCQQFIPAKGGAKSTAATVVAQKGQTSKSNYLLLAAPLQEDKLKALLVSTCLDKPKQAHKLVKLCGFEDKQFTLMYRASRDGFDIDAFYKRSFSAPKTLIIVRSQSNNIFGGYTQVRWKKPHGKNWHHDVDPNTFLFSLVNREQTPMKMSIKNGGERAVLRCDNGFHIGQHDLVVLNNSNEPEKNMSSFSQLGNAFEHPHHAPRSDQSDNFLAGSQRFRTTEIEVYRVN